MFRCTHYFSKTVLPINRSAIGLFDQYCTSPPKENGGSKIGGLNFYLIDKLGGDTRIARMVAFQASTYSAAYQAKRNSSMLTDGFVLEYTSSGK